MHAAGWRSPALVACVRWLGLDPIALFILRRGLWCVLVARCISLLWRRKRRRRLCRFGSAREKFYIFVFLHYRVSRVSFKIESIFQN